MILFTMSVYIKKKKCFLFMVTDNFEINKNMLKQCCSKHKERKCVCAVSISAAEMMDACGH